MDNTWIPLVTTILLVYPLVFCFYKYLNTKIIDYLLFVGVFLSLVFMNLISYSGDQYNILFIWQLHETANIWLLFMLFFHSVRTIFISRQKAPKYNNFMVYMVLTYCIILQVMVLFWTPLDKNPMKFSIWSIEHTSRFDSAGAGLFLPFNLVYSTGVSIFRDLLSGFVFIFYCYAYWSIDPIHPTDNVKRSLLIWRATTFLFLIASIRSILLRIDTVPSSALIYFDLPSFIGIILMIIVIVFYPESFLISKSQITRLFELYDISLNQETITFDDANLLDYLSSIPRELLK